MTADRVICEFCAGDERIGDLTPVHIRHQGPPPHLLLPQQQAPKNCLELWLREQRAKYDALAT